mgnify:CR=1 FL=1
MIVIEKNAGPKIPYEVNGTVITFDDELSLELSEYQKDDPVHKDICYDADGDLQIGTKGAKRYVAELDIPARQYETVLDEDNNEVQEPKPLDMDEVTLTLWAIA